MRHHRQLGARLRTIPMTSFTFIIGVIPLMADTGARAEVREALGTVVFFGNRSRA
jgi:multidrug efflux pump subunit AcrB